MGTSERMRRPLESERPAGGERMGHWRQRRGRPRSSLKEQGSSPGGQGGRLTARPGDGWRAGTAEVVKLGAGLGTRRARRR